MRFLCFFLFPAVLSAQILVNGSFEAPVLSITMNVSGAFSFSGWSGVASSSGGNAGLVVGVDNGLGPAQGVQHYTFNGGNPSDRGWIEQGLNTVSGMTYSVSFSVGRSGGGQALSLSASVNNVAMGDFLPPAGVGYSVYSFMFVAASDSSLLRFTDTSGGNSISDLYLDAVSVSAVGSAIPEPGTYAAIVGGVMLSLAAFRKAKGGSRKAKSEG